MIILCECLIVIGLPFITFEAAKYDVLPAARHFNYPIETFSVFFFLVFRHAFDFIFIFFSLVSFVVNDDEMQTNLSIKRSTEIRTPFSCVFLLSNFRFFVYFRSSRKSKEQKKNYKQIWSHLCCCTLSSVTKQCTMNSFWHFALYSMLLLSSSSSVDFSLSQDTTRLKTSMDASSLSSLVWWNLKLEPNHSAPSNGTNSWNSITTMKLKVHKFVCVCARADPKRKYLNFRQQQTTAKRTNGKPIKQTNLFVRRLFRFVSEFFIFRPISLSNRKCCLNANDQSLSLTRHIWRINRR